MIGGSRPEQLYLEAALPHLFVHLILHRHLIVMIMPILQRGRLMFYVSAGVAGRLRGKEGEMPMGWCPALAPAFSFWTTRGRASEPLIEDIVGVRPLT